MYIYNDLRSAETAVKEKKREEESISKYNIATGIKRRTEKTVEKQTEITRVV